MNTINAPSNVEHCWNVIGVVGDRSCPELSTVTHCRNCPVYSTAGRQLLERSTLANDRNEWTELFAESQAESKKHLHSNTLSTTDTLTILIFRLQQEWLALPANVLKETTLPSIIHTLPHRSNQILRGLVNIRGELHLCISLSHFLNLQVANIPPQSLTPVVYSRMLVVEKANHIWAFDVDELYGIQRFHVDELRDAPKSVMQANQIYSQGFFQWRSPSDSKGISRSVSYLDDELLFTTLARKVLSS